MNVDRTLAVIALIGAVAGPFASFKVLEWRADDADRERRENRSRTEQVNQTLHQRITRTDNDVTRLREEALRQLADMKQELGSLDTKIERNHAETSTRLDAVLDRLGR